MKKWNFYFFPVLLLFTYFNSSNCQSSDVSVEEGARDIVQNYTSQEDTTGISEFVPVEKMPEIVSQVKPVYPLEALRDKIEGRVWIKLKVDVNGNPTSVVVVRSTNSIFEDAAVTAAKGYKFTPAENKGKTVAVWVVIPFKFDLEPDKKSGNDEKECYYQNADEMPSIVGGMSAFMKKLVYPKIAKKNKIEGQVLIIVFVDEIGDVVATQIGKSIGSGCDEAAEKAARSCKFTPAKKNGKNVKAQLVLPVQFKLK